MDDPEIVGRRPRQVDAVFRFQVQIPVRRFESDPRRIVVHGHHGVLESFQVGQPANVLQVDGIRAAFPDQEGGLPGGALPVQRNRHAFAHPFHDHFLQRLRGEQAEHDLRPPVPFHRAASGGTGRGRQPGVFRVRIGHPELFQGGPFHELDVVPGGRHLAASGPVGERVAYRRESATEHAVRPLRRHRVSLDPIVLYEQRYFFDHPVAAAYRHGHGVPFRAGGGPGTDHGERKASDRRVGRQGHRHAPDQVGEVQGRNRQGRREEDHHAQGNDKASPRDGKHAPGIDFQQVDLRFREDLLDQLHRDLRIPASRQFDGGDQLLVEVGDGLFQHPRHGLGFQGPPVRPDPPEPRVGQGDRVAGQREQPSMGEGQRHDVIDAGAHGQRAEEHGRRQGRRPPEHHEFPTHFHFRQLSGECGIPLRVGFHTSFSLFLACHSKPRRMPTSRR